MLSRRHVLYGGLGAITLGLRRSCGLPAFTFAPDPARFAPLADLPLNLPVENVAGLPFATRMTGDPFPNPHRLFPGIHAGHPPLPVPDVPHEYADIVVIGGGISGLASAYLLRDRHPIVLELGPRFGGNARGERWRGINYSLGGAYVITPDDGTFLDTLYRELRLDQVVRVSIDDEMVELGGHILPGFWDGIGVPPADVPAFTAFAELVTRMAEKDYPEIPLPKGDVQWILDLDVMTFRAHIERELGGRLPDTLVAGIQSYCYSSFGGGWEEISAASGWNFLAAEEFGRWVCPGGNAYIAHAMWQALAAMEDPMHPRLRAAAPVHDVRLRDDGVLVSYLLPENRLHAVLAENVVMACPKHVAKYLLHDLARLDPEKRAAMDTLQSRAYVVINVLLDRAVELDFYDIFLLGDATAYPHNEDEAAADSRVADVLSGHFAHVPTGDVPRSVLTLYWPLPWSTGRQTLVEGADSWRDYAERVAPQIRRILRMLDVPELFVRQIRMTAWGHAMPLARPGHIADGTAEALRRPFAERIHFVHQDNWALPAVENCLLDAETVAAAIRAGAAAGV
ncbi:MAG: FAD-dependent oxidoreductase [Phycisphaerales bacterium]|nr:FAD-dependent oxidoreductase [Phycisphaerales bacterium]